MDDQELLGELQKVIARLGIELRIVNGEFVGGICRLKGKRVFLINSTLSTQKAIEVFCHELRGQDLSKVFVLPAVRHRLEGVN